MAEKRLTTEFVEQFLEDQSTLDLSEFTPIEDAAAEILRRHPRLNLE